MLSYPELEEFAIHVVQNPKEYIWLKCDMGYIKCQVSENSDLEVWDSSLRKNNVSQIHTHPRQCYVNVVFGCVSNTTYCFDDKSNTEYHKAKFISPTKNCQLVKMSRSMSATYAAPSGFLCEKVLPHSGVHTSGTVCVVDHSGDLDYQNAAFFSKKGINIILPEYEEADEFTVRRVCQSTLKDPESYSTLRI